ncbi:UvrD-helicase domain-containing protein [Patescibacteria group bacterium]|nr:UvrD-helicase domain-containing protein [Patescibacteria group bacterium]
MDLLSPLNPTQRKAVEHFEGAAIVLAGPGSGKTRVITHRIAHLIKNKGVAPAKILGVTFTNKAANEMKGRVLTLLGTDSPTPTMGTFHSICARILREDGGPVGLGRSFVIFDGADSLSLVKEAMKDLNIDVKQYSPGKVKTAIESAKNELVDVKNYISLAQGFFQEEIVSKVYEAYQKKLEKQQAADFDDLLLKTVLLFKKYPEILKKYQRRWGFILVDEYQDTNKSQYELTKLLAGGDRNIFIVGDASQAIYGWRGANFRNILNFSADFPENKVFNLEQNYRSTKKILAAATAVISQNRSHPILNLWTQNSQGSPIITYEAKNELDEAGFVTRAINKFVGGENGRSYNSFAVLYRTNAQSRVVEEAFLHEAIPYILVGGVRFYERREVKDILSYLRLLVNPKDEVARKRVINVPPRGIGQASIKSHGPKVKEFDSLIESLRLQILGKPTIEVIDQVLEDTSYLDWLDDGSTEAAARVENVKELRSVAAEFPNINDFLENVALVEREYGPAKPSLAKGPQNAVTLMTAHAAKGLEFPIVFIIGMEEGLFPHNRSLIDTNELEEERRLCYVGITRAKEQLYLTYATNRLYFGQRSEGIPSRFLIEIPQELITTIRL